MRGLSRGAVCFLDIAVAKRGAVKIHLSLVAQAFQPVQKRVEGRCSINNPQFSQLLLSF
jgi:hypothetical protein